MPGEEFFDNDLTMAELENSLKGINLKSAPGNDGIRYLHLKNLSQKGKLHCLRIFNKSWKSGKLIVDWKIGEVTMIGKDKNNLNDPVNYRPISLTKCMGKIMEKIVNNRLVYFLNKHDVISNFQSGFRSKRQTTDNLLFLSQKAFEAYGCKKMMCGVVMDIQKAFDKVWHKGLIYKMSKLNLPVRMGKWIKDSVEGSQFYVKVGKEKSDLYNVTAGVFQGRILSPLLFSIYINDIELINKTPTNKVDTLMFADDIFSLTADHNIRRLFILMQQYLDKTEKWFKLWRMKLSAHKCYYSIFTKGNVSRRIKDNKLKKLHEKKMEHQSYNPSINLLKDNHDSQLKKPTYASVLTSTAVENALQNQMDQIVTTISANVTSSLNKFMSDLSVKGQIWEDSIVNLKTSLAASNEESKERFNQIRIDQAQSNNRIVMFINEIFHMLPKAQDFEMAKYNAKLNSYFNLSLDGNKKLISSVRSTEKSSLAQSNFDIQNV